MRRGDPNYGTLPDADECPDPKKARELDSALERRINRAVKAKTNMPTATAGQNAMMSKLALLSSSKPEADLINDPAAVSRETIASAMAKEPEWRELGRENFMEQLARIEEAQRVLQLAWDAGYFDDLITTEHNVMLDERTVNLCAPVLEDSVKRVQEAAYALLADQYPDIMLNVRTPARWEQTKGKRCWARVVAGRRRP